MLVKTKSPKGTPNDETKVTGLAECEMKLIIKQFSTQYTINIWVHTWLTLPDLTERSKKTDKRTCIYEHLYRICTTSISFYIESTTE